jgi:hypothetical protein
LGQSFYEERDSTENPTEAKALKKCRAAVVNYAKYHGFDMLNVTFAYNGFFPSDKDTAFTVTRKKTSKTALKMTPLTTWTTL